VSLDDATETIVVGHGKRFVPEFCRSFDQIARM
jgi:hypothetical protein